jgi:putative endonuclease
MSAATQRFGEQGERVAERWLRRRGWRILDRRWRSGRRDLDLVAVQGDVVAFVEVKARRRNEFGGPVEAVGWRKQRELRRSAACWIDRHGAPGQAYRFDVIGVWMAPGQVRVRHVADAFASPLSG